MSMAQSKAMRRLAPVTIEDCRGRRFYLHAEWMQFHRPARNGVRTAEAVEFGNCRAGVRLARVSNAGFGENHRNALDARDLRGNGGHQQRGRQADDGRWAHSNPPIREAEQADLW